MSNSNPDNTQALIRKFDPLIKDLNYHELTVLNNLIVERIRMLHKAETLMSMSQFHVGDRVSWDSENGVRHTGVVIRLNQKTVSVKTGEEGYWNVSPHFLRRER
jgi:hypothetical protein